MKDPAFLFYPGDYLRDTQTLSENTQVAYDRIMCEHMRNICISPQQLKFFTKRLSEDELEEIMFILKKVDGGYQIEWVAESIINRRKYSESRRENRKGKKKEDVLSYDKHMENENEIENESKIPSLEEVVKYFLEKGYKSTAAKQAFEYYTNLNWHNSKGKPVLNWKNTMLNNWFTEKNKEQGRMVVL